MKPDMRTLAFAAVVSDPAALTPQERQAAATHLGVGQHALDAVWRHARQYVTPASPQAPAPDPQRERVHALRHDLEQERRHALAWAERIFAGVPRMPKEGPGTQ